MKIGFILECAPKGPDADIYPYLAMEICKKLVIEKPVTLGNKQRVMEEGAINAKLLLEGGCDYVFIIWDRIPKWGGSGKCDEHTETLNKALLQENVNTDSVYLCCIDEMLESWMIVDGRGVSLWLQGKTDRPIKTFRDCKTKALQSAPKERVKKYVNENYGKWIYNDYQDNFSIVKELTDLEKIARGNSSFLHFKESLEGICV